VARPDLAVLTLLVALPFALGAQARPSRSSRSAARTPPPTLATEPPSIDSLAAISRRGRTLAQYDEVAWLGSGAMTSLSLPQNGVRQLITRRTESGWEVATGELSESGHAFLLNELATPGMQKTWASSSFDPPQPDSGYFARAGRAIATALAMFRPTASRAHIATVVPAEDGPWWWVYVYPAPVQPGVWPRGGDTRFKLSADGRIITETRHLHDTITEYSVRSTRAAPPVEQPIDAGNTPEDTDVFHVLQRRPALPEIMTAGRYRYRIDVDGSVRLIGAR
jgi:hypothetical protein